MGIAIETRQLTKTFENGVTALKDLSFSVREGEIFGLLGPNGAGKTTTVRLLNGTLTPTSGVSSVLGISSGSEEIRLRTSTLAELAQMYESITVEENLRFFARMYDLKEQEAEERIQELLRRLGLWEKRTLKLGSFSTGMKKRVYLARTLLHRPKLLFLDEPTSGLDPDSANQVNDLIKKLAKEEGATILLCTHNLSLAEGICDSFGFLKKGSLVRWGTKEELIRSIIKEEKLLITTQRGREEQVLKSREEINSLIKAVMDRGEKILEVSIYRPTLEDVYFTYIKRNGYELEQN